MISYLCVLLIFMKLWTCSEAKFVNKALYCVDPDTNTLHPVNSTWTATNLCGTYTCKIRKKNDTEIEVTPTKTGSKFRSPDFDDPNSESNSVSATKYEPNLRSAHNILRAESTLNDLKDDDDRYLTETEIKTISEVLHTVKKSDLDSIMEIYNLAQDLYKAIDKESSVGDVESTIAKYKINKEYAGRSRSNIDYLLQEDDFFPKSTASATDMHYAGTNNHIIKNPIVKTSFRQAFNYDHGHTNSRLTPYISQFSGPTNSGPIPYIPQYSGEKNSGPKTFIPQYSGQTNSGPIPYRLYSYNEPSYTTPPLPKRDKMPLFTVRYVYTTEPLAVPINQNTKPRYESPKDASLTAPYMLYTVNTNIPNNITQALPINNTTLMMDDFQKLRRQSRPLLPYPFLYMQQYDHPYPTLAYNKEPLNVMTGKRQKTYIGSSSLYNLFKNDGIKNKTEEDEEKPKETAKKDNKLLKMILSLDKNEDSDEKLKFPPWKTPSLSSSTLEDIRANIPKKTIWFKTFPLRRKIELENVGKALKLDELVRTKRDVEDFIEKSDEIFFDDEYEAYVEKKVCETDLEPGFFRLGNVSLPYPSCCPQRIKVIVN